MVWNNFEEGIEQRVDALRYSMDHQSPILVAYASGSRAGQERMLTVVSGLENNNWSHFDAKETNGDINCYASSRILWIVDANGTRHENKERMQMFTQFQAAQAIEKDELSRVFLGTCNGEDQPALDVKNMLCADHFQKSIVLTGDRAQSINVVFRMETAQEKIVPALKYLIGRSQGRAWNVVGFLLEAGFWVPAWAKYTQSLRLEGTVLRGATVRLRDSTAKCDNFSHYHYLDSGPQREIYDTSRLRPPMEDEDSMIDRLRLFEAEEIKYPEDLLIFKGLPPIALGVYVTTCTQSCGLIKYPSSEMDATNLHLLLDCGLLIQPADMPIQTLVQHMRATELYAPIKARNVKMAKRGLQQYYDYYSANMDDEYETLLRASEWLTDMYMFAPPTHWSWNKFLDFRTSYVAMIKAIVVWLSGRSVGVGENAYFLKG